MFSVFAVLLLKECDYNLRANGTYQFFEQSMKKGQRFCLRGDEERLLFVTNKLDNVELSYSQTSKKDGKIKDLEKIGEIPFAKVVPKYGYLEIEAKQDTTISLSALTVGNRCEKRIWATNEFTSSVTLSRTAGGESKLENHEDICFVFGTSVSGDIGYNVTLDSDTDSLTIMSGGEEKAVVKSSLVQEQEEHTLAWFLFRVNSDSNTTSLSIDASYETGEQYTKQGSGFVSTLAEVKSGISIWAVIGISLACVIIAGLVIGLVMYFRKRRPGPGYIAVQPSPVTGDL